MTDDNIIQFQPLPKPHAPKPPPMFNIPIATKVLTGIILCVHLVVFILSLTILPNAMDIAISYGGFTPASWTLLSVLGFSFLHAGWMHLAFNTVMLVAMGSGLEKSIRIKNYLIVYFGATLFAVFAHLALYPDSMIPIIGASGGISGIFGAMIYLLNKQNAAISGQSKRTILPIVAIYIGISVIMGLMGAPDGASVAWVAHIGGFLAGIGIMMLLLKQGS